MIRSVGFNARAMAFALLLTAPVAGGLAAQVFAGDAQYAKRATGARGAQAQAGPIDAAIAAYNAALAQNGNDVVAHARLLRALRFKGAYVAQTNEEKREVYGTAKTVGERALASVGRALAARGVKASASEKAVAAALRNVPGAADVYLWDAVNWGEWALAYGKFAAARQGAADHIRRNAMIAHLADPKLEGGAPSRVLGRLYDQTPRIPFLTGWASPKEAVRFLNESVSHDPANKLTLLFLAEAMVAHDASSKKEAVELLNRVIHTAVDPAYAVEDAAAQADARRILESWRTR